MIQCVDGKYIKNYYTVKKLHDDMYKVVYCKMPIRRKGVEVKYSSDRNVNDKKLRNNVARARVRVFEYAICNEFDYFITLTINGEFLDRCDLGAYVKKLGQFIRDYRKQYGVDIQYLLVPEKHRDGAWHMHGLIKGIPQEHLSINENGYLDWKMYSNKFGYCSIDVIKNKEAVSKYITKYISKSFHEGKGVTEKEKKLYYCSRGLKKPVTIQEGILTKDQMEKIPFQFENEYVKTGIYNLKEYEEIREILDNDIRSSVEVIKMGNRMEDVYEGICQVSKMNTDFDVGFDVLFEFMCEHPGCRTTREFIRFHRQVMGDPSLEDGRPEFTYLIGRKFDIEFWVHEEDIDAFMQFAIMRILDTMAN